MKVIKAPEEYLTLSHEIPCFMAGGLQRCEWHDEFLNMLKSFVASRLVVYNPKRESFELDSEDAAREQIAWEFKYLNAYIGKPYIFSMYFDNSESQQPICFYELGRYLALLDKASSLDSCVISCHPYFSRKLDVETQVKLATNGLVEVKFCSPREHATRVYGEYRTICHMQV